MYMYKIKLSVATKEAIAHRASGQKCIEKVSVMWYWCLYCEDALVMGNILGLWYQYLAIFLYFKQIKHAIDFAYLTMLLVT